MEPLRSFLDAAFELVFPRACAICGSPLIAMLGEDDERLPPIFRTRDPATPLCPRCISQLQPSDGVRCRCCGVELVSELGQCMRCRGRTWAFDEALPIFEYRGAFRSLLQAYKFRDRRSLAPFLASIVEQEFAGRWPGRDLVPVPPRPGKLRSRGWDQVEEIARLLERRGHGVRRILLRLPSSQQKRLGLAARAANASTAYRLAAGARVPERLVLLDDVITTGATAHACAAALREGGARELAVLALAYD